MDTYFLPEIESVHVVPMYPVKMASFGYRVSYPNHPAHLAFVSCRDKFQNTALHLIADGMFFVHPPLPEIGKNIAAFINKIETMLEISPTLFKETNYVNQKVGILWLKPSPFWLHCQVRKSLFTLLLRCGMFYVPLKENFYGALNALAYSKTTLLAIEKFLKGYTEYKGLKPTEGRHGWQCLFQNGKNIKSLWPSDKLIIKVAHKKFLESGGESIDNWLKAEKELVEATF